MQYPQIIQSIQFKRKIIQVIQVSSIFYHIKENGKITKLKITANEVIEFLATCFNTQDGKVFNLKGMANKEIQVGNHMVQVSDLSHDDEYSCIIESSWADLDYGQIDTYKKNKTYNMKAKQWAELMKKVDSTVDRFKFKNANAIVESCYTMFNHAVKSNKSLKKEREVLDNWVSENDNNDPLLMNFCANIEFKSSKLILEKEEMEELINCLVMRQAWLENALENFFKD